MWQDLLGVFRFALSMSFIQCTISTSILSVPLRERKAVEACELKNKAMLFWVWQVWTQLQIEIVAVFEVSILFLGPFFLRLTNIKG
jgi:hypothetical protein